AVGVTNTVLGPLSGVTTGTFNIASTGAAATNGYYEVLLAATDSVDRKATNSVRIYSVPPASDWTSFYPFDNGAQDASNRFNGALNGGASIQSDAARGNVLNLSGSSQYVRLPAGASAEQSIAGWVKWRGGNAWQRVFDFGNNTLQWFFLT